MPILRILCLNIGQRRPEDEMPKWGSFFGLIPKNKNQQCFGAHSLILGTLNFRHSLFLAEKRTNFS